MPSIETGRSHKSAIKTCWWGADAVSWPQELDMASYSHVCTLSLCNIDIDEVHSHIIKKGIQNKKIDI